MGAIPKLALKESQLNFLTLGTVQDGSHQTFKVKFIENGKEKQGFYKKLAPKKDYPELLAKISVAVSLFKRLFQGKRSAEERLVFDDQGKLLGTLSINVEGFIPFNFSSDPVPKKAEDKEWVIPSTKILVEKNFMEILFGRWFLNDDDGHPHNLSLAGDIDFDMFMYWFTIYMKSPRLLIGIPNTQINLTVEDWERFPNVKEAKPYHWPTYKHPGKETIPTVLPMQEQLLDKALPKVYADPIQFESLASQPIAQEQKFAAALKALLTFQPDLVKAKLHELFGDMTLNYTSLDESDVALRLQYEEKFPEFCNKKTNAEPFIDFIMTLYQQHYDNLYRVVVFYMGCENNGYGLSILPTYAELYHKPSYYKKILEWIKNENQIATKEEKTLFFKEANVLKRYHQVWRDSYAPVLNDLLHESHYLINILLQVVTKNQMSIEKQGLKITDHNLTNVWQLFGNFPDLSKEKIEPFICVDKDSKLREALCFLIDLTCKLYQLSKNYYMKEREHLTVEDNQSFVSQLGVLFEEYNLKIRENLAHTSTYANLFVKMANRLKFFIDQANFKLHLLTTDEQMKEMPAATLAGDKNDLPVTSPEVLCKFNKSLFDWAASLSSDVFEQTVTEIIHTQYKKAILSNRHRTDPVLAYLEKTKHVSNDNRLAYILCSGNEDGALNQLLIQYLTPKVLTAYYIPSITQANRDKQLLTYINTLTKSAIHYAQEDQRFNHLCSTQSVHLLFEWVKLMYSTQFKTLINESLKTYESNLSSVKYVFFGANNSRRKEVENYLKTIPNQAKIVAMIFVNGAETSTFNLVLFENLIQFIKLDLSQTKDLQKKEKYRLFMENKIEDLKALFFPRVKAVAVPWTHEQEPAKVLGL